MRVCTTVVVMEENISKIGVELYLDGHSNRVRRASGSISHIVRWKDGMGQCGKSLTHALTKETGITNEMGDAVQLQLRQVRLRQSDACDEPCQRVQAAESDVAGASSEAKK